MYRYIDINLGLRVKKLTHWRPLQGCV